MLKKIEGVYPSLSKGHKKIAQFIAEHYDRAAFMTAAKLGDAVGTSESTVVRFATELGFDGYPEMQSVLQDMIRSKLTAVQRMEVTSIRIGEKDIVEKMLQSDIEMIKSTIDLVSRDDFKAAVEAINKARKIYILGVRSSASLASFMAFNLNLAYDNVVLVDAGSDSEIFEETFRINENDVCIAVSFPRYSNQIINALRFISDTGATVIAITDSEYSPIATHAKYLLLAKSDIASYVDSLVAPLSLINALIVAATLDKKDEVSHSFVELERIWDKYHVYDKIEESGNE